MRGAWVRMVCCLEAGARAFLVVAPRARPVRRLLATAHAVGVESKEAGRTAVWLQSALRLADNPFLEEQANPVVLYVWRHAEGPPRTAAAVFECAAALALNDALERRGSRLVTLGAASGGLDEAARAVGVACRELGASTLVADAGYEDRGELEALLRSAFDGEVVVGPDDASTLFEARQLDEEFGRQKNGARPLKWAAFLGDARLAAEKKKKNLLVLKEEPLIDGVDGDDPSSSQQSDAPPLSTPQERPLPENPAVAGPWAAEVLEFWAPVTEARAWSLARAAKRDTLEGPIRVGEAPSQLSPFLRFGLIHPRRAAALGAPLGGLIWRDWSRVVWHACARDAARADRAMLEAMDQAAVDGTLGAAERESRLDTWKQGRTGAPLVDAGMRQLWRRGWMPRRVRLLCAAALTEGYGLDWRNGRDWFAETLVDHDPAINEAMWQNAGLCGIDPFYKALRWEKDADPHVDAAYVQAWATVDLSNTWPHPQKNLLLAAPRGDALILARRRADLHGSYEACSHICKCGAHVRDQRVVGLGRAPAEDPWLDKQKARFAPTAAATTRSRHDRLAAPSTATNLKGPPPHKPAAPL